MIVESVPGPGARLQPRHSHKPPVRWRGAIRGAVACSALTIGPLLPLSAAAQPTLTLREAVDAALSHHPLAGSARARMSGTEARRDIAAAQRLPRLNSSLTLTRFQEPMVVAPLHGFDPTSPPQFDRGLVQIGLGLEYTLFDGGGRRARLGAAEAAAGASRAGLAAAELEVIQTVVAAYVGVLTAREVDHAARQREVDLGAERGRSMRFLAEGAAARVEVLRAEAALQDAKAAAATATARAGLALRNLARATGIEISALMRRPLEEVSGPTGADEFPGSPSELLGPDRTPAIERAGRAAEAARFDVEESRALRVPRIEATAALLDFGSTSGDFVAEWKAGLRISWPVFTGGARRGRITSAEAALRVAEEELRNTRLQVGASVDAAATELAAAGARAEALAASVAQWEEVSRIEALSLEAGSGVQRDFLQAQAGLFAARAGHADARHQVVSSAVRLAAARGVLDRDWIVHELGVAR